MRFVRFIIQLVLNPLATKKRRACAILTCAGIGLVFPSERVTAAATLIATVIAIIQIMAPGSSASASASASGTQLDQREKPGAPVGKEQGLIDHHVGDARAGESLLKADNGQIQGSS